MISEGSCASDDWSNYNSALLRRNQLRNRKVILNWNIKLEYNFFLLYVDQMHAALLRIIYYFYYIKTKWQQQKRTDPKCFNSSSGMKYLKCIAVAYINKGGFSLLLYFYTG